MYTNIQLTDQIIYNEKVQETPTLTFIALLNVYFLYSHLLLITRLPITVHNHYCWYFMVIIVLD